MILGTESVGKLLLQYTIPSIVAMTASSLYNMIDSIFIGQGVGTMAIAGLAITFPFMNLGAAFGSLVGVGASTMISVKLGQQDEKSATLILGNVVMLNIIIGLLFTIISLLFLDPILYFFGASEGTITYARDYMQIILIGNVITHMYLGLNAVLRASGYPEKAMYATVFTVIINCVFNAILIFVMDMGIKGAAIATICAQLLALLWQINHFCSKKSFLHFNRKIFKLKAEYVKSTLSIGLAPFLMNLCSCFIVILINKGLKEHGGDLAIGAYGIVNRIAFFFVMIVMGINQGMQPVAGYNYGAQLYPRVTKVLKLAIIGATCVMTLGFLSCELFPGIIARAFTSDSELIAIAIEGMRIVFMVSPIIGFQMVTSNFFQSIGKAGMAIFLSLSRQLIFLIPFLLFLPRHFGTLGVWISLPLADLSSSIISGWILYRQFRIFHRERERSCEVNK